MHQAMRVPVISVLRYRMAGNVRDRIGANLGTNGIWTSSGNGLVRGLLVMHCIRKHQILPDTCKVSFPMTESYGME